MPFQPTILPSPVNFSQASINAHCNLAKEYFDRIALAQQTVRRTVRQIRLTRTLNEREEMEIMSFLKKCHLFMTVYNHLASLEQLNSIFPLENRHARSFLSASQRVFIQMRLVRRQYKRLLTIMQRNSEGEVRNMISEALADISYPGGAFGENGVDLEPMNLYGA